MADVLQNHAWPELNEAHQALETAEQLLIRLEQLSQEAAQAREVVREAIQGVSHG